MRYLTIAIAVSSCAWMGCVEGAEEDAGEGQQEVSQTRLSWHSCPTTEIDECHPQLAWLGAPSTTTCALTGVSGSLVNRLAYVDPYMLWLSQGVSGGGVCFAPAPDAAPKVWVFGAAPVFLGSGPNLQCVLDGIYNNSQGMQLDTDWVGVYRTRGGFWYLSGDQHGSTGASGRAYAHCFDVTTRLGVFDATSHGSTVIQLLSSNAGGGVVCALTKLGGRFTSVGDSVVIDYDAPSAYWTWTLTGRKTAQAACFR